jgi:spermidine/putrescine transport system substrate-binding protein
MKSEHSFSLIMRASIIAVWFLLIGLFLYSPYAINLFQSGRCINMLVWGQVIDKEFLADFEKKTGVQINLTYFENNEELFVKLRSTENHGYDIIMPSDWAAELLIKEGIIKKLDQSKINFWQDIYPALLHNYFDPDNEYTIPYYWTLYGVGVNTDYFDQQLPPATWKLVFDPATIKKRIATFEDIRPLVLTAALYLFGRLDNLNEQEIEQIKALLKQQKEYVEIYTDHRAEYVLASGSVSAVAGLSGDFLKVIRRFDNISFLIPCEGAFTVIDSFAITATSDKDDIIYPLLSYLFNKNIVKQYVDKFEFFPAVQVEVDYDERFSAFVEPTYEIFKNVHFFKNVLPPSVLNEILLDLKA